jgi:hypothetical protein
MTNDIRTAAIEAAENLDYRVKVNADGNLMLWGDGADDDNEGEAWVREWLPPAVVLAACADGRGGVAEGMVRGFIHDATWRANIVAGMSVAAAEAEINRRWS